MTFDQLWKEFIKQHSNTPDSMRPMIREAMRLAYECGHKTGYDTGWDAQRDRVK